MLHPKLFNIIAMTTPTNTHYSCTPLTYKDHSLPRLRQRDPRVFQNLAFGFPTSYIHQQHSYNSFFHVCFSAPITNNNGGTSYVSLSYTTHLKRSMHLFFIRQHYFPQMGVCCFLANLASNLPSSKVIINHNPINVM